MCGYLHMWAEKEDILHAYPLCQMKLQRLENPFATSVLFSLQKLTRSLSGAWIQLWRHKLTLATPSHFHSSHVYIANNISEWQELTFPYSLAFHSPGIQSFTSSSFFKKRHQKASRGNII